MNIHKITKKNNEYFLEQTQTAKRKITKEDLERDLAEEKRRKMSVDETHNERIALLEESIKQIKKLEK